MRNTIKVNNHRLISRSDLAAIADMIPHGAKILDLGCGSGRLLKALKMLKDAKIMGVSWIRERSLSVSAAASP